jgi:hypothetical protein
MRLSLKKISHASKIKQQVFRQCCEQARKQFIKIIEENSDQVEGRVREVSKNMQTDYSIALGNIDMPQEATMSSRQRALILDAIESIK